MSSNFGSYEEVDIKDAIVPTLCVSCGIPFGLLRSYESMKRRNGKVFYCPNGHTQAFKVDKDD